MLDAVWSENQHRSDINPIEQAELLAEKLDRIRLAGAFGAHIDVMYATVLGMIPDCDLSKVTSAGNAAGTGARIALLDSRSRHTIESLVGRVEKIETAIEPRFQEHFVEAMAIPHKTADYPNLRKDVELPPPNTAVRRPVSYTHPTLPTTYTV